MIHIKIASDKEMLNMKKCCNYSENDFYRILESTDEIPFQDMESRKLIREIDHAERIEGDRYAMMTPTGKNCLTEYSCAVTPQVRQTGNRLSGLAGTAYASLLA